MSKKISSLILIGILVAVLGVSYFVYGNLSDKKEAVPQQNGSGESTLVPDFTVYDMEGNAIKFSSLQGKPIILNFWATWCTYCEMEMPYFQKAYDTYGKEVSFIFMNTSHQSAESQSAVKEFMTKNNYTFPVYFDKDGEGASVFSISGVPATFGLDAQGNLLEAHPGMMGEEDVDALAQYLLKK